MSTTIRNTLIASAFCLILISIFQCGSSGDENKKDASAKHPTYKNLSSSVKYIGIEKCRQCHYDKYETFIETGMGKSFDRATKTKSSAKFDSHSVVYDKFSDLYYHPFWSDSTLKIMEYRLEGKDTVHKRIETVDYIIGSGHHTNSHIFSTNGYLHQMPMTFYTQKGEWDLPPGYEQGYNSRFSRKIGLECMSCHNSLPDFVQGSENKFNAVPNGIGCERCHGPGEIHVKEKEAGLVVDTSKEIDYSIVNPAKLSIDLQFDACQRCHLQGNAVLKEGKSFYDFHPGMKLSDVMDIFLPKYENADEDFIMASHADRLKQSQCFIKTTPALKGGNTLKPYKNGLTCVTCHNPHISVKVTGKEVFNNACKNCHGGKTTTLCSEKPEARSQKQDNCVFCHMPKSGSIDIPHVTITDHFIRKPVKKTDIARVKKFIGLFAINDKNPAPNVLAEAYLNQYEKFDHNPALLDSAKKYLASMPFNLLIRYYFIRNDFQKIITEVSNRKIAQVQDQSESAAWACYYIAEAFSHFGKSSEAYLYYKKAASIAPYNLDFQNKLAGNLYTQNKITEAKEIYEKIIAEDPDYAPAWSNVGFIYLQSGNSNKARECYDKALALDPDYEQALLNKAGLFIYEKKNSDALALVKRILKKNPKNEQALAIQMHFTK